LIQKSEFELEISCLIFKNVHNIIYTILYNAPAQRKEHTLQDNFMPLYLYLVIDIYVLFTLEIEQVYSGR